jgi:ribulose 1,5-bisphosphate carboxylase large subunit-like protein
MKKLILMLVCILTMIGCVAQDVEGQPPVDIVATMTLSQVDDTTATFVSKNFAKIFEVDSKPDMIQGYEYKVRIIFPRENFKNKIIQATLAGYTISPAQAARNTGMLQGKGL